MSSFMKNSAFFVVVLLFLFSFIYVGTALAHPMVWEAQEGGVAIYYLQDEEVTPDDIQPVLDEYQNSLSGVYQQAVPLLILVAYSIITILKYVLPGSSFKPETIYLWVVAGAGALYGILTILGVSANVPAILDIVARPASLLLELLTVMIGPSVVYLIAKVAKTPFFGDKMGEEVFSVQRE